MRAPARSAGRGAGMRQRLLAVAFAAALTPATCISAASPFRTNDITSAGFEIRGFELTDHHGRRRTLADFKGKVVVLVFGFTSCPDVCPTTLAEFAGVLRTMGKDAGRVQVLFVTLDPARDTQHLLSEYVPSFHPSFLGLRGTDTQTRQVAREFRVFYRKVSIGGNYTLDHSTHSYVFDADGRLRLFLRMGLPARDIAHDIRILLAGR
jgi:protein SCO1/2